jgi:hypothetical protein
MSVFLAKYVSGRIASGRRLIKAIITGKSNVQEINESAPYGLDSQAIKDMVAVYAPTSTVENKVIIGYINKKQLATAGEFRTYSTDTNGTFKFNIWQRADGTCLIGDSEIPAAFIENFVKWAALNTQLQAEVTAINSNLTAIQTAITGLGGAYVPVPITLNITTAKTDKIKTI